MSLESCSSKGRYVVAKGPGATLQLQRGNLFKLQMEVNECDSRRLRF